MNSPMPQLSLSNANAHAAAIVRAERQRLTRYAFEFRRGHRRRPSKNRRTAACGNGAVTGGAEIVFSRATKPRPRRRGRRFPCRVNEPRVRKPRYSSMMSSIDSIALVICPLRFFAIMLSEQVGYAAASAMTLMKVNSRSLPL